MKIKQTQDTLTIENSGVGSLVFGAIFFIIGAVMVFIFGSVLGSASGASVIFLVVGSVFGLMGIAKFLFASSLKVSMQKGAMTIVAKRRLFGGATTTKSFPTSDIQAVDVEIMYTSNPMDSNDLISGNRSEPQSALSLVFRDNSSMKIGSRMGKSGIFALFGGSGISGGTPFSKEADQIANFLGVKVTNKDSRNAVQDITQLTSQVPTQEGVITPPSSEENGTGRLNNQ